MKFKQQIVGKKFSNLGTNQIVIFFYSKFVCLTEN
jgi:hypothetical protein